MTMTLTVKGQSSRSHATLKEILESRRQETLQELQHRLRDAREEWTWTSEVRDMADSSELDGREDIAIGLIGMKADLLHRIDEALLRIHHGTHGRCGDCHERISEHRLRALPFAARCKECEEAREYSRHPERSSSARERVSAPVIDIRNWRPHANA